MKATTLKGKIRAVEREIADISITVNQEYKSLDFMTRDVYTKKVCVQDVSKELLAALILDGIELIGDRDGFVYFYQERQETEDEFNKRINCKNKSIASLEAKKEKLEAILEDLKELKRQEDDIYKNPEYIQYLRLKKQFEDA